MDPLLGSTNETIPTIPQTRQKRTLIAILEHIPRETLQEISPQSVQLKDNLKTPFVLIVLSGATMNAVACILAKVVGEIFIGQNFNDLHDATLVLIVLTIVSAALMLLFINVAMWFYNNLDIIPCYHAFEMINKLICGQLLLNEIENYAIENLLGLLFSTTLIIVGIKIQTSKTNQLSGPIRDQLGCK